MKKSRKLIAILATLALLATLLVPMVGPAAAGASSYGTVTKLPVFDPDGATNQFTATIEVKLDPALDETASTAKVEVLDANGKQLTINKVEFTSYFQADVYYNDAAQTVPGAVYPASKSFKLGIIPQIPQDGDEVAKVYFKLYINADDCAAGEININFFSTTGQLDGGKVVVAKASTGKVGVALVGSVPTIGEAGAAVTIRLSQTADGALKTGNGSVKFKLPKGFSWDSPFTVTGAGNTATTSDEGRVLNVNITTPEATVDVTATVEVSDPDVAKVGEVIATTDSDRDTDVTPGEIVVANYSDYGVKVTTDGDVKEVLTGQFDTELTTIYIKENVDGSLIPGRKTKIEFPKWVKITDVDVKDSKSIDGTEQQFENAIKADIDGDSNEVQFTIPDAAGKTEFKLKFTVSIKANASGDIVAKVSGRGGVEGEVTVGKALPPVTATSKAQDIKVGVKGQPIGDIIITETKKEALAEDNLIVALPSGVNWSGEPTVEVTEGDLDIDEDGIDVNDNELTIPVKVTSFKPSTIKISGAKVDLDRTIPEGVVEASIKGPAVVGNDKSQKGWLKGSENPSGNGKADVVDEGEFDQSSCAKVAVANVVTPAPGEQKATVVFTINDTSYTVNGIGQTMDVAPYIKDGRTFLPVRYVAQALGVTPENILYADGKVTLIKGDKVVQLTIGSNVMVINGIGIAMDVPAEIKDGRTMLPFRWVAQALGAKVNWDEATQTVTMEL